MSPENQHAPPSAYSSPTFGEEVSFYLNKPVGSASISPCGRDIVLASREGLHIIDLDSPYSPPRHLKHYTPWEIADVQWSPFAARDYWIVSTSNQKAIVWNVASQGGSTAIEHTLHGHNRAVTDINFSAHHPDILTTCAVDGFVHCWDLRQPRAPAISFCDWFAGATQVKWNRQDPHILASSHDKFLRIWDERKGAKPLKSIKAHSTKIYGVDWDRTHKTSLTTCSLDKHMKIWDYSNDVEEPLHDVQTSFPIWRARYTPFGWGLLAMPQRGDYDLHLYDRRLFNFLTDDSALTRSQTVKVTHRFSGHQSPVKEFLWRHRGTVDDGIDNREFQLVSWGTDRFLRLHQLNNELLESIGHKHGKPAKVHFNLTRKNAKYRTFRDSHIDNDLVHKARRRNGVELRSSTHVFGRSSRAYDGAARRASLSQEADPISWMRGVQIRKRDIKDDGISSMEASSIAHVAKSNHHWNSFDTLGEEITSVADRFTKVRFEKVDMNSRRIEFTLSGPWGIKNGQAHMRCFATYPREYLGSSLPVFRLDETAMIEEGCAQALMTDISSIAVECGNSHRPVLEYVLCYLLGEHDRDGISDLLQSSNGLDVGSLRIDRFDSSDEDDEADDLDTRGLDLSDGALIISNSTYNVPLPRACGASWSNAGLLICYFPKKDGKSLSMLDNFDLFDGLKPSKEPFHAFSSFGRLQKSGTRRHPLGSVENAINETSTDDDESSSSSNTSTVASFAGPQFFRHIPWTSDTGDLQRIKHRSIGGSHQSSNGPKLSQSQHSQCANIVCINTMQDFLPQSRQMAEKYLFGGEPLLCCRHNANVAESMGFHDISESWLLLLTILQEHSHRQAMKSQENANAFEIGPSWGTHSLEVPWLINPLISHYDRLADVQTLAMILCIVYQAENVFSGTSREIHEQKRLSFYSANGSATSIGFSSGSSPLRPFRAAMQRDSSSSSRTEATSFEERDLPNHHQAVGSPFTQYRNLLAPHPLNSAFSTSSQVHPQLSDVRNLSSAAKPLSIHQPYLAPRSNSALVSPSEISFPQPMSFAKSTSSIPANPTQKGTSLSGSFPHVHSSLIAKRAPSLLGRLSIATGGSYHASLPVSSATNYVVAPDDRPKVKCRFKNQDRFLTRGTKIKSARGPSMYTHQPEIITQYAELLETWGLVEQRIEFLKQTTGCFNKMYTDGIDAPEISALDNAKSALNAVPMSTGPQLSFDCSKCDGPTGATYGGKCLDCSSPQESFMCLLCEGIVTGLSTICLQCRHCLHLRCRRLLALESVNSHDWPLEFTFSCVPGCGCDCRTLRALDIMPVQRRERQDSEDTAVFTGNIDNEASIQTEDAKSHHNLDGQAYESLARNLGKKKLVPRSSQTWGEGDGEADGIRRHASSLLRVDGRFR